MLVIAIVVLVFWALSQRDEQPTLKVGEAHSERVDQTCPACLGGSGALGLCWSHSMAAGKFKTAGEKKWYVAKEAVASLEEKLKGMPKGKERDAVDRELARAWKRLNRINGVA